MGRRPYLLKRFDHGRLSAKHAKEIKNNQERLAMWLLKFFAFAAGVFACLAGKNTVQVDFLITPSRLHRRTAALRSVYAYRV